MATLGLLFSGGKDSALAALILEPYHDLTLLTGTFGVTDEWRYAATAAESLGLAFERLDLKQDVAHRAVEQVRSDGYPRTAIQSVHEHALEVAAATGFDAVADGTRRDDRSPRVTDSFARSLEDRHGVEYLAPLRGIGHRTIDRLTADLLVVETGPSADVGRADYEGELRAMLGPEEVRDCFPPHEQSRVVGRAGT